MYINLTATLLSDRQKNLRFPDSQILQTVLMGSFIAPGNSQYPPISLSELYKTVYIDTWL